MVSSATTISASFISKRSRSPVSPPNKKVHLKVKNQLDGGEDIYRVGENAPLKKLMEAYCRKKNLDSRTIRFFHNQKPLKKHQTPAQLMMEDDDIIDAFMEQGGGGPLAIA